MARIIENDFGRRNIIVNTNDIISIVQEYQRVVGKERDYEKIRKILDKNYIFITEDL